MFSARILSTFLRPAPFLFALVVPLLAAGCASAPADEVVRRPSSAERVVHQFIGYVATGRGIKAETLLLTEDVEPQDLAFPAQESGWNFASERIVTTGSRWTVRKDGERALDGDRVITLTRIAERGPDEYAHFLVRHANGRWLIVDWEAYPVDDVA